MVQQQDYLERQIETLARALSALMHFLIKGKLPTEAAQLSLQIEEITGLKHPFPNELEAKQILETPEWTNDNTEELIRFYLQLADESDEVTQRMALVSARYLLEGLEDREDTYSFRRAQLQSQLEQHLLRHGIR